MVVMEFDKQFSGYYDWISTAIWPCYKMDIWFWFLIFCQWIWPMKNTVTIHLQFTYNFDALSKIALTKHSIY